MVAESSCDFSSIPPGSITSKLILAQVFDGDQIRAGVYGVTLPDGVPVEVLIEVCVSLFRFTQKQVVRSNFELGDIYLRTKPYSEARHLLGEAVAREFGKSAALRLRQFGSVAKCWPKDRRTDKYAWEYYRTHKPGEVGKADVAVEKRPISLKEVSSEDVGGVVVLTLEGHGGQKYTVRRPRVYEEEAAE